MNTRSPFRRNRFRACMAGAVAIGLLTAQFVLLGTSAAAAPGDGSGTTAADVPSADSPVNDPSAAQAPAAEAPAVDEPAAEAPGDGAPPAESPTEAPAVDEPAAPQLSIAIDNGRTSTTTGDRLDYTITVQNIGATDLEGLQISQTRPEGLRFEAADAGGADQPGLVLWAVDLGKGQASTLHSTMTVLATPDDLLRLASVACVKVTADGPPIVCAAHSDQLPAGAKAEADQADMTVVDEPAEPSEMRWYIGGGIAALAVVVVLLTLLRMRSRRRSLAEEAANGGPQPDRLVNTGPH